jgi:hypothetical protein
MLLLCLLSSVALARTPVPLPPCDKDAVRRGTEALAAARPDMQEELAARALSMTCGMPESLRQALFLLSGATPDLLKLVDVRAAEDIPQWMAACPGGPTALVESMKLAPTAGRAHIWTACDLQRIGWFTEAEWTASASPPVTIVLAAAWLQRGEFEGRVLTRALLGVHQ